MAFYKKNYKPFMQSKSIFMGWKDLSEQFMKQ